MSNAQHLLDAADGEPSWAAGIRTMLDQGRIADARVMLDSGRHQPLAPTPSLVLRCRLEMLAGNLDLAMTAGHKAVERLEGPADPSAADADAALRQLVALAVQRDQTEIVETGLETLLRLHPDDAQINNSYAKCLCARNAFAHALPHLRIAAPLLRHHDESLWTYTTALALIGQYEELLTIQPLLDELAQTVPPPYGPYRHLAVAKLSLQVDRERVLREMSAIEQSHAWLDTDALIAQLTRAIAEREPFSFVRMFDGEARFLSYLSPRVQKILRPQELSAMVNSIWQSWFKEVIESFDATEVLELGRSVLRATADADVLGIASSGLAGNDYYHFGFLAEMQAMLLVPRHKLYTDALVHHDLHRRIPFLRPLIENQPFLGFVGCHPDVVRRLADSFNIASHASFLVPGENGRSQLPAEVLGTGHFPLFYRKILAELRVPFIGAVFLVAAGLLGKVYCARIKELGGIAIDIGALADGWMGYNTRPGQFDKIEDWRLEA